MKLNEEWYIKESNGFTHTIMVQQGDIISEAYLLKVLREIAQYQPSYQTTIAVQKVQR